MILQPSKNAAYTSIPYALLATLGLSITGLAYAEETSLDRMWQPLFNFNASMGNTHSGEGALLLPLSISTSEFEESIQDFSYGHFIGKYNQEDRWFFEAGVGHRSYFTQDQIHGINLSLAYVGLPNKHRIWMLSSGIEAIGDMWRASANVYWPLGVSQDSANSVMKGVDIIANWEFGNVTPSIGAYYSYNENNNQCGLMAGLEFQLNSFVNFHMKDTYTFGDVKEKHHIVGGITLTFGADQEKQRLRLPLLRHKVIPAMGSIVSISSLENNNLKMAQNALHKVLKRDVTDLTKYYDDAIKPIEEKLTKHQALLEAANKLSQAYQTLKTKVSATETAQNEHSTTPNDSAKKSALDTAQSEEATARNGFNDALTATRTILTDTQYRDILTTPELASTVPTLKTASDDTLSDSLLSKTKATQAKWTALQNLTAGQDATTLQDELKTARDNEKTTRESLQAPVTELKTKVTGALDLVKKGDTARQSKLSDHIDEVKEVLTLAKIAGITDSKISSVNTEFEEVKAAYTSLEAKIDAVQTAKNNLANATDQNRADFQMTFDKAQKDETKARTQLSTVINSLSQKAPELTT